jgi:para-nitrobenzyl esterase
MLALALALLAGFRLAVPLAAQTDSSRATSLRVTTEAGMVEGFHPAGHPELAVFRGIPYAAPPVAALRWREPRPAPAWDGVRAARESGPACPQDARSAASLGIAPLRSSEDCLTLDVYSPTLDSARRAPVVVWVHGGGNRAGSAALVDGMPLAEAGVVVVAVNYRLGVLGFLAHPALSNESPRGASGNYGLLDQLAALRWVQRNIGRFGGDPGRVTVAAEEAGAGDVAHLMTSPFARNLVHRVILQGGTGIGDALPLSGPGPRSGLLVGARIAKALGVDTASGVARALRAKSVAELVAASRVDSSLSLGPTIDGWLLPAPVDAAIAQGEPVPVPVIVGYQALAPSRRLESLAPRLASARTASEYAALVRAQFGLAAPEILRLYPPPGDAEVLPAVARLLTDERLGAPARYLSAVVTARGGRAYLYVGDARDGTAYWARFATTGDPNGPGLPRWPLYDPKADRYLALGAEPAAAGSNGEERRRLALLGQAVGLKPGAPTAFRSR